MKIEDKIKVLDGVKELENNNRILFEQLNIALDIIGQIAMHSKDKVDAIMCAKAICDIKEVK